MLQPGCVASGVLAGSYLRRVSAALRERPNQCCCWTSYNLLCCPSTLYTQPPPFTNLSTAPPSLPSAILGCWQAEGEEWVGVQQGGAPRAGKEGAPSIRFEERVRSDAARPRRGESARHIWNCRFDLPSSLASPPRGPYKVPVVQWGFSRGDASCYQPGL